VAIPFFEVLPQPSVCDTNHRGGINVLRVSHSGAQRRDTQGASVSAALRRRLPSTHPGGGADPSTAP
jgi:hypothetical protein